MYVNPNITAKNKCLKDFNSSINIDLISGFNTDNTRLPFKINWGHKGVIRF